MQGIKFLNAELSGIKINGVSNKRYYASLQESISRILSTRLGERVMRPEFGSNLYLLRDRKVNDEFRLLATKYTFEAIEKNEPRVAFKKLHFTYQNGKHHLLLELEAND